MDADKLETLTQTQLHSSSVVDMLTVLSQEIDDIEDVGWPIIEHLVWFRWRYGNGERVIKLK